MPSALSFVEYNDLNLNHDFLKNHPDMSFIAMFNLEFSTFKHLFLGGVKIWCRFIGAFEVHNRLVQCSVL